MSEVEVSPCIACGACCTCYRVSFYWREAESDFTANPVPSVNSEDHGSMYRRLTVVPEGEGFRCAALQGEVGKSVHCQIYEQRPSPCRNFKASYENGGPHELCCDEARGKRGLSPLAQSNG